MSGETLAYVLYGCFGLGALAVFFALPQEGRWPRQAAPVLGLSALTGLLVLLGTRFVPQTEHHFFFHLFAAVAIFAAVRVITHARPVYSAVYFVLVVVAVAGMMVLLAAEFLAAALIIIYAGAILVTYVFVMMLAQHGADSDYDRQARSPLGAVLAGFVLTATIAGAVGRGTDGSPQYMNGPAAAASGQVGLPAGNTAAVGATILGPHVVPLELAGILLLVAMVGALAIALKKVPVEAGAAPSPMADRPLGEAGREAAPFSPELKEVP